MSLHKLMDVETEGKQKKIAEGLEGREHFPVARNHMHTQTCPLSSQ